MSDPITVVAQDKARTDSANPSSSIPHKAPVISKAASPGKHRELTKKFLSDPMRNEDVPIGLSGRPNLCFSKACDPQAKPESSTPSLTPKENKPKSK
jgi:hypothetical protein